jgi:hypothetical protein
MPFRTRLSFTRGTPRGLFGSSRFDGDPFIVGEFVAHDSILQFWSLNHGDLAECNALARPPLRRLRAEADVNHLTIPPKSSKMTRSGRVR